MSKGNRKATKNEQYQIASLNALSRIEGRIAKLTEMFYLLHRESLEAAYAAEAERAAAESEEE